MVELDGEVGKTTWGRGKVLVGKRIGVGKWERQLGERGRFWWGDELGWGSREGNMGKWEMLRGP